MRFSNRFLTIVLLALAALTSQTKTTQAQEKDNRPNILFIFSDDHAYQAIGAYDSKVNKTPNLDGVPFENQI